MTSLRAWAFGSVVALLVACGSGSKKAQPDGGVSQQCTPVTCAQAGKTCGAISDGCGGAIACGSCPSGESCGATNVCEAAPADGGTDGGASDGGSSGGTDGGTGGGTGGGTDGGTAGNTCIPTTCATQHKNCGAVPDGCGGMIACGTCPNGQVCGGDDTCSAPPPACVPTTCSALGKSCGNLPDGCGGTLACGTCGGSDSCGGAGTANVCGTPPVKGGDTRWVEFIDSGAEDAVQRVATDKDGNVVAASIFGQGSSSPSLFLRKYGGDGSLKWEKRWSFDARSYASFTGLATSPALGNVFVALQIFCSQSPCNGPDLGGGAIAGPTLVKLDPAGAFDWQLSPGDVIGEVSVDSSGSAAVSGYSYKDGLGFATKYDYTGKQLWSYRTGYTAPLAFDPSGNLAIFTNRDASGNYAPTLLRLDPDGKLLWSKKLDGYLNELGTSSLGTIVGLEFDHLAAFEASDGAQRFRIPLPMWARGLGVDPAGRAAVAGQDSSGCNDLAVRYYTLDGTFQWSRLVGAIGSCGGAPQAYGAAIRAGDVLVGGAVTAPTDLGSGTYSPKSADGFLLDLAP
ncbi:MAG TPA: hypothetical protein VFE30_07975 [Anaeromyxobacteraceae bacterium]|jgi:hypothetical protein|nr:hypothetical protein [Anaeromyxobacteraceae bacterium]